MGWRGVCNWFSPLLLAILFVEAAADVPPARGLLDRVRVCFAALDLECASREAEALAPVVETLDPPERLDALRLISEVRLATGRKAEARDSLVALLVLEPDWSPPGGAWPPAWLGVLEQARRLTPDRSPPVIRAVTPQEGRAGQPLDLQAIVEDPSGVGSVTLYPAIEGASPLTLVTRDGRTWTGTVPSEWVQSPEFRFWVEAFDSLGHGPARLGSPEAPRAIPVSPPPEPPSRPVVRQWWFWTAVGLGAAALATGITLVTRGASGTSQPAASERGHVRVEVLWPNRSE